MATRSLAGTGIATTAILALTRSVPAVVCAQIIAALLLAAIGIHAGRLRGGRPCHGCCSCRSSCSSGGWREHRACIDPAGCSLAAAVLVGILHIDSTRRAAPTPAEPSGLAETACQDVVESVTDYLDVAMPVGAKQRFEEHLANNLSCRLDTTDNGDPGTRDTYAFTARTSTGVLYHQVGTTAAQLPVKGGGVVVRTK